MIRSDITETPNRTAAVAGVGDGWTTEPTNDQITTSAEVSRVIGYTVTGTPCQWVRCEIATDRPAELLIKESASPPFKIVGAATARAFGEALIDLADWADRHHVKVVEDGDER